MMDIDIKKLQDDLESERRVSCAMGVALGDIAAALGMDENDAFILPVVNRLIIERDALRAELQQLREQEPVVYLNIDTELGYTFVDNGFADDLMDGKHPLYAAPVVAHPSQAAAIPEFLIEMSKQMRDQPSRSTAHPFWQVRCKRTIVTEQGYGEIGYELIGDDGVVYRSYAAEEEDLERLLLEDYREFCQKWRDSQGNDDTVEDAISYFDPTEDDLPEGLRLVYVQEIEEVVSTHFTEHDALWFIRRKQHDYPKLSTWVESAYWSPQLRQLQDWIISLSAAPNPN